MKLIMAALEHSRTPIEVREVFSMTQSAVKDIGREILSISSVSGCVLLSTCNRTEVYLSLEEAHAERVNPAWAFCLATGVNYGNYSSYFDTYEEKSVARHLMEVAAGLRSRVFGEDQILTQVRDAISCARDAGTVDPVLETLFRTAVTAGKAVRCERHLTALPRSAAGRAVELVEKEAGGLDGRRALVIGNGEMGREAARFMTERGCEVTITMRSHRHGGQTVVPCGCQVVPYERRFEFLRGVDILISATASPHYTVTLRDIEGMDALPKYMVDLAMPRDIQPEVEKIKGVTVYNVDHLGETAVCEVPQTVYDILDRHEMRFYRWRGYRDSMSAAQELKDALVTRILTERELEQSADIAAVVELAVDKTVDLISGGLERQMEVRELLQCSEKIRSHTTARPIVLRGMNKK